MDTKFMDIKPLQDLMQKPMTRKEFLKHMGAVTLGLVGVSAFLRNLSQPYKKTKETVLPKAKNGYGSGRPYGA